jgi:hypothetical protein
MTIFKTEKDKKEFVAAFRKMTMSGAINKDVAIAKLIRNNPHFFHQPTADELKKISHSEMNAAMRAGVQSNKLSIDFFRLPADKQKPA